jgi:hypothetical protein
VKEHDKGQGSPDQKPTSQNNAYLKEQGKPSPGFTERQPEQSPQGGGIKSSEREPLPSVWDILERKVRIHEERSSKRMTYEEYDRERCNLNRSLDELYEKGTARDGFIQHLYNAISMEPTGTLPDPVRFRHLSLEEFQQLRSRLEPLSDEQLAEEKHKAEEEFERKKKAKPITSFPTDGAITV